MKIIQITLGLAFLALLALGSGLATWAQVKDVEPKWETYDRDRNDVKYSYDKGTLSYPTKNTLQVRRQRVFPPGSSYREIITFDEIDCKQGKYRTLEIRVTNKDGSVQEFKKASEWAYIYGGMPEDYFLSEQCK